MLQRISFVTVAFFTIQCAFAMNAFALKIATGTQWTNTNIRVCWLNPQQDEARSRRLVRSAVENSWEAVASIDFYGWEKCSQHDIGRSVIIDVSDSLVGVVGTNDGLGVNALQGRVQLNFTFNRWRGCPECRENLSHAIRYHAIHEFGHVLGFIHEQSPYCSAPVNRHRVTRLSPDDPYSIMKVCYRPIFDAGLSEQDIASVQRVYGKKNAPNTRDFPF